MPHAFSMEGITNMFFRTGLAQVKQPNLKVHIHKTQLMQIQDHDNVSTINIPATVPLKHNKYTTGGKSRMMTSYFYLFIIYSTTINKINEVECL